MKKLISVLLFVLAGFELQAQNPTIINPTNGLAVYPPTRKTGNVIVGINTNGATVGYAHVFTNAQPFFTWSPIVAGGNGNYLTNSTLITFHTTTNTFRSRQTFNDGITSTNLNAGTTNFFGTVKIGNPPYLNLYDAKEVVRTSDSSDRYRLASAFINTTAAANSAINGQWVAGIGRTTGIDLALAFGVDGNDDAVITGNGANLRFGYEAGANFSESFRIALDGNIKHYTNTVFSGLSNVFSNRLTAVDGFAIQSGATSNFVWTCTNTTSGLGQWLAAQMVGGGGNVFTTSNNTFVVNTTNTFNGVVSITNKFLLPSGSTSNYVWTSINTATGEGAWIVKDAAGGGGNVFTQSNNTFLVNMTNTFNGQTVTSNLYVRGTVAVGTNAPAAGALVHVLDSTGGGSFLYLEDNGVGGGDAEAAIQFMNNTTGANAWKIGIPGGDGLAFIYEAKGSIGGGTTKFTMDTSGNAIFLNTLQIGTNGTAIILQKTATASLDFPSIASLASADLTIALTGANTNDSIIVGRPITENAGLITRGFVSAVNTVTVRASNTSAAPVDQGSLTYRVDIIKH